MRKKLTCTVLALMMVGSLAACGGGDTGTNTSGGNGGDGATYTFKLAHHLNEEHIGSQFPLDFAEQVKTDSNGAITVDVYGNSQLGTQAENAEAIRMGTLDFCINDFPTMATVYPKADVVALPYIFEDFDHVNAFFESDEMAAMIDDMAKTTGVRIIGPSYDGFRDVFTQTPVKSVADMQGLQIRVPDIPIYVSCFKALGCSTTIVSFSELYTALQTGVVTGLENAASSVYTSALYEQTKYIADTHHIFCDTSLMANENVLNSLSDDLRQVVLDAGYDAAVAHRQRAEEAQGEYISMLEEKGMESISVNREEFRDACSSTWDDYKQNVEGGAELIDYILSLAD
ncbi:MAG: TRAP transporter substrate-binding protein [Eubacteriales bacterium]